MIPRSSVLLHHDTASKRGTQVIGVFIIDLGRPDLQFRPDLYRDMVLVITDPNLRRFLGLGKCLIVDIDIEMAGTEFRLLMLDDLLSRIAKTGVHELPADSDHERELRTLTHRPPIQRTEIHRSSQHIEYTSFRH